MKATRKKTRWLLIALLFGFLAATGLTLLRHHHGATVAKTNDAAAPRPVALPQPHGALAAIGGKHALSVPAAAAPGGHIVASRHFSHPLPPHTGHSNTPPNARSALGAGAPHTPAYTAGGGGPARAHGTPSSSSDTAVPAQGAGEFANSGYVPLDCELPAGCGASGGAVSLIRDPSGTSGRTPPLRNTGSAQQTDGSDAQTSPDPPNGNTPPGTGSDTPQQHSDPPVASAPELDPATLAGAVTLLLGALALVSGRRRRVRATR